MDTTNDSTATAIAERPTQTTAIQPPQATAGPGRLQNGDRDDLILPRVHIFQGLQAERKQYGEFKAGEFVNTLTGEVIDGKKKFAVITGWKEWIKWREPRGSGMEYRTRDKRAVPPADLAWNDAETDPKKRKPRASEYINWVVLFVGETFPVVLSFKSTSLRAGKTIESLQALANGRTNLYAIGLQEKSNDQGAWLAPVVRPAGAAPEDFAGMVAQMYSGFTGRRIDTNEDPTPDDVDE